MCSMREFLDVDKRSAHLTDKLASGTATRSEKENMPAVYDELENRQTEDRAISSGMLPTAEVRVLDHHPTHLLSRDAHQRPDHRMAHSFSRSAAP